MLLVEQGRQGHRLRDHLVMVRHVGREAVVEDRDAVVWVCGDDGELHGGGYGRWRGGGGGGEVEEGDGGDGEVGFMWAVD